MSKRQALSLCALLLCAALPAAAQNAVSAEGLKLNLTAGGGVSGVVVGGKAWPLTTAPSGLLVRDAAAGGDFAAAGGAVTATAGVVQQAGTNEALKLDFAATYRARAGAVEVSGLIHDRTGQERALTVRFALPVDASGGTWWDDLLKSRQIAGETYLNVRRTGVGATGDTSAFPWGAVSAAPGELCLGVPLDHFVVHRIAYDGQAKSFYVDFDFGLSPLTTRFPSRADFRFVIYPAGGSPGFRAATAAYYALFPEAFTRRATGEGLWMPFTDIAKVQDPEDFNFAFQEGASNVPWDEAHGIASFRYISPHWAWLWMPEREARPTPEFVEEKLAADLKSDNPATRKAAETIVNCAAKNSQGAFQYTIGQAHWAPHKTGYLGWYAMYPANADPDLMPPGQGPTTGSETMATVDRDIATYNRPGAFLDGFYFDGVDERPLDNYAREQFASAEAPLTFGTDTKRPLLCGAFSSYKFLQRVATKMHASGRLTMANGIPSQFPFSVNYLDLGGSEQEPSIESAPVSVDYLAYARALMYHKPLVLLYKPRLEERFDRDLTPYLVDYMHACLPYAAEPSLFMIFSNTDASFYYNFWERPDWYNRYRQIFVDYCPLVKRLALAGWEPVTGARAGEPSLIVERYGTANPNLVVYNPARQGTPVSFDLDVDAPRGGGAAARTLGAAVNLVDGSVVPTAPRAGGGVRAHLVLAPRRAAVLAFASRERDLAGFDLGEAARYVGIAGSRLQDKLHQASGLNFEEDAAGTGTPSGFSPYREGEATFASDTKTFHSAPRATRVTLTGQARAVQSAHLPVPAGGKLHFSLWGRANFPTPGKLNFYVRWQDQGGKALATVNAPELGASGDWQELTLDATAPDNAASAMLALVVTRQGEGTATAWFDDPGVTLLGADGKTTQLLPVPPVVPTVGTRQLETALRQRAEAVRKLAAPSAAANGAALCGQVLGLATELVSQAQAVRRDTPELPGVAAALDVSAERLRRAGGILAGWRMTLTGGGEVAQGETVPFEVCLQAGPVALKQVQVTLAGGNGAATATPRSPAFDLAANQTRTLRFTVKPSGGVGTGERVTAVTTARVTGGKTLELQRDASYAVVAPCESSLLSQGQDESGATQRLLLTVRNMRRAVALAGQITVTTGAGFTPSITTQNVSLKPRETLRLPITLTAGPQTRPGWCETTVKVVWDGGERTHQQPQLYLPATANLLKNPGFEQAAGAGSPWSPCGQGGYTLDTQVKHTGTQALKAVGPDSGAVQGLVLNQTVARPLVVRGWSKCEQVAQQLTIGQTEQAPSANANRSPDYSLYVDLHYMDGTALYGQVATFDRTAEGWQFAEQTINVTKPVKDARVYLLHRGLPGAAWFDDVFLAEGEPDQALLPGVKVSADSTYSGYTTAPLVDGVTDTTGVPWDKAAWASEDKAGEHWVEVTFPRAVTLKTVLVYWAVDVGNTWTSRAYSLQVFVEGNWQTVATVSGQSQREVSVHSFAPVATTRLRLLQSAGGGHAARPNILWLREIAAL